MNMIIRYYNKNRKNIFMFILIVAFIIIILQMLNEMTKKQNIEKNMQIIENNNLSNSIAIDDTITNLNNGSKAVQSKEEKTIELFVNYCNEGKIDKAYDIITSDCKEALFQTINDFKLNYVQKVFNQKKNAKIEMSMYGDSIYKVTYYNDLLSNGGYTQSDALQDYIRVTKENNEEKISLNKFLYTEKIEKSNNDLINIKILKKQVFINYEIYQIQITNNTNDTILLANKENGNSIYITNDKKFEYLSNLDEQVEEKLILQSNSTSVFNIKFNKVYNQLARDEIMVFSNIITNYEEYQKGKKAEEISINIQI